MEHDCFGDIAVKPMFMMGAVLLLIQRVVFCLHICVAISLKLSKRGLQICVCGWCSSVVNLFLNIITNARMVLIANVMRMQAIRFKRHSL